MDWDRNINKGRYTGYKISKLSSVTNHPLLSSADSVDSSVSRINGKATEDLESNKRLSKEDSNEAATKLVTTTWNGLDPLSAALSDVRVSDNDTLTDFQDLKDGSSKDTKRGQGFIGNDFVSWSIYRSKILNKFHTAEKLSIKSSFQFDKGNSSSAPISNVSQKVKNRLEQLDELEESAVQEMKDLSQQDYQKRMEEMNQALKVAWESDQRVKALKIAIQCAKQLSSVNVIHFYPSKFVLVTDILNSFGQLVYERIEKKVSDYRDNSSDETCRNWFYKISSIRELLPRFYIECSILHIYKFLIESNNLDEKFEHIFLRLTKMIRGIGDPLVAVYCRVYLCRVVINLYPESKRIFLQNIFDLIDNVDQVPSDSVQQCLSTQNIDYPLYYTLYNPPLNWLFSCLFYKGPHSYCENTIKYFRNKIENFKVPCSAAFVLGSMISSFPSTFLAQNLQKIFAMIKILYENELENSKVAFPKFILLKNIGESLIQEDDFFRKYSLDKKAVFEEFWKLTKNLKMRNEYISCLETWSEIIAKFSSVDDINKFLEDVFVAITIGKDYESFSSQLLQILTKIVINGSNRIGNEQFFAISNLLPFLDLFSKEEMKVEACKVIVTAFIKNSPASEIDNPDPVVLNLMTHLCKLIHDSINSLTLDDEKRQISNMIIGFIRWVSFKQDLESRLNFYIESRANFSNLDSVLGCIVNHVNSLGMETHKLVNGHHTKKTISFVNACIAFSYITIPSIYDIVFRLQLYLSSSHVALVNGCLPQTDAFLKLTITTLRQLPPYSESFDGKLYPNDEFLYSFTAQLLSLLIVVPDNPELGVLYLFKGLYNVLKEFKFEAQSNFKILIWMNLIRYLTTCSLDIYPYHVDKVDSNDTLYAQGEEFLKEIETYVDIIFREMLELLEFSRHEFDLKQQCNITLEFLHLMVAFGHGRKPVCEQLWQWVLRTHEKNNVPGVGRRIRQLMNFSLENYLVQRPPGENDEHLR